MDWLTFIVELVNGLAWPVVLCVLAFLFRRALRDLLPLLRRLRIKDYFELEFGERVREAAEAVEQGTPSAVLKAPDEPEFVSRLLALTQASPRAAVMEAWLQVEREALAAIERRGVVPTDQQRGMPVRLVRLLERANVVPTEVLSAIDEMRRLRNNAAHELGGELTAPRAAEYVLLAGRVASVLRSEPGPE